MAIKLLHPEFANDPAVRAGLLSEGRAANCARHAGVVRVFDDDVSEDGAPFLVMELLGGETLKARCQRAALNERALAVLLGRLLDALSAVHAQGLVHCDIKPENVFVLPGDAVKLFDFGIAHQIGDSTTMGARSISGTPGYMSPEQARGADDELDGRSDVWAVGALAFRLLSGRLVHEGSVDEQLAHAASTPARSLASVAPHVSAAFVRLVDGALSFQKEGRWPNAHAMQCELERTVPGGFGAHAGTDPFVHDARGPAISPIAPMTASGRAARPRRLLVLRRAQGAQSRPAESPRSRPASEPATLRSNAGADSRNEGDSLAGSSVDDAPKVSARRILPRILGLLLRAIFRRRTPDGVEALGEDGPRATSGARQSRDADRRTSSPSTSAPTTPRGFTKGSISRPRCLAERLPRGSSPSQCSAGYITSIEGLHDPARSLRVTGNVKWPTRHASCSSLKQVMSSSSVVSPTVGAIERLMVEDHARIDRLLSASEKHDGSIEHDAYARFRHDLLRHIAMEEKVLLPYARTKRAGEALPVAASLRADHGEIAKLLVPSPTSSILAALRELLARHNALEEGPRGLYSTCDDLAGDEAFSVVERLSAQPNVPLAKYYDGPLHRHR